MKIALVVGHRESKQGAYGNAGISEYEYWNSFIDELIVNMGEPDYLKKFLREDEDGYTRNMIALHNEIDDWGADIAVSHHFNSFSDKNVNGHEVLYNGNDKASFRLAKIYDDMFSSYLENNNRGVKPITSGRGNGFLSRGKTTNILIEPYFASHQSAFVKGESGYDLLMNACIDSLKQIYEL